MSKTFIVKKESTNSFKPSVYKKWTDEEVDYLKKNYKNKTNQTLAKYLGRTVPSVAIKAKALGLTDPKSSVVPQVITEVIPFNSKIGKRTVWSKEEVTFLKENYGKLTILEIAEKLGRSAGSVTGKAFWIKTEKKSNKKHKSWTEEDIQYLSENANKKSRKSIAKKLNRTIYSVTSKLHEISTSKQNKRCKTPKSYLKSSENVKSPKKVIPWGTVATVSFNLATLAALSYLIFVH